MKLPILLFIAILTVGCSPSPIIDLFREIDTPREELTEYYRKHKSFPKDLGIVDSRFENRLRSWNGWRYTRLEDGYTLEKYTGHGRDSLWFTFDLTDRGESGWFLNEDNGKPTIQLGFSDKEKDLLRDTEPFQQ